MTRKIDDFLFLERKRKQKELFPVHQKKNPRAVSAGIFVAAFWD
jgi:hypothetical protein